MAGRAAAGHGTAVLGRRPGEAKLRNPEQAKQGTPSLGAGRRAWL